MPIFLKEKQQQKHPPKKKKIPSHYVCISDHVWYIIWMLFTINLSGLEMILEFT